MRHRTLLDYIIMIATAIIVAISTIVIFSSMNLAYGLDECDEGYWGITSVETNLDHDYETSDMGMFVDRVTDDLYVGSFLLNDGWLTFQLDGDGAGTLNITTFTGFAGTTRAASDSVYFLPEVGEAGFSRPGLWEEQGIWHCVLSDYCVRMFTITQLTKPEGCE